jgi:D-lyxose ketol-isomerase
MKRSEINAVIRRMESLLAEFKFALPPFLEWTPADWAKAGHEYDEIRDNMLGWDVTDYGMGNYKELGIALITIRNGNVNNPKYTKTYAEKVIMIEEGQVSPMHFHWSKMEDIINRGGGNLIFRLYNADKEEKLADTDVEINKDGRKYMVKAGEDILLKPGESLSLYPYYYHEFVVEPGSGRVLLGEVSMSNDDNTDNRFLKSFPRFPKIEEDEAPYRLLCTEYPKAA